MNTTQARCQRCGYLNGRCECAGGPVAPAPPPITLPDLPDLLTPGEMAALFRVDAKTVTRWAQQGKIRSIRTLGGHRRYRKAEVEAFLSSQEGGQS